MMAGLQRVMACALLAGAGGCATQHATSQALTVAGAAAVVIGASMAADEQCYGGPSDGAALVDCAGNRSKGVRNTGKGIAVAGVGLAAAGYALKPRGPDDKQWVRPDPNAAPASPYRLIRREPPAEPTPEPTSAPRSEGSPGCAAGVSEGSASEGNPCERDASDRDASEPGPGPSSSAAERVAPPGGHVEPPGRAHP